MLSLTIPFSFFSFFREVNVKLTRNAHHLQRRLLSLLSIWRKILLCGEVVGVERKRSKDPRRPASSSPLRPPQNRPIRDVDNAEEFSLN